MGVGCEVPRTLTRSPSRSRMIWLGSGSDPSRNRLSGNKLTPSPPNCMGSVGIRLEEGVDIARYPQHSRQYSPWSICPCPDVSHPLLYSDRGVAHTHPPTHPGLTILSHGPPVGTKYVLTAANSVAQSKIFESSTCALRQGEERWSDPQEIYPSTRPMSFGEVMRQRCVGPAEIQRCAFKLSSGCTIPTCC